MANSIFLDTGDVTGPSSSTDGAVAVFSGTTGKIIKVGASSGTYVNSITGTANQITASAATGAVTLSTPSVFIAPGSIQATTTVAIGTSATLGQILDSSSTVRFDWSAGGTNIRNNAGSIALQIPAATTDALFVGNLQTAATTNTKDIGATGAVFRTGYFGTSVVNSGANGQMLSHMQTLTELTTIAAAAFTDTTIQMPANSVVLGVAVRVTTVIPTATNFTVGDSGSATRFSTAAVSSAAGSTDPGTKAGAYYNATALSVRITPDASPAANTGRVRVVIYYYSVTPPTS